VAVRCFIALAVSLALCTTAGWSAPLGSKPLEPGLEDRTDIIFFESYDDDDWDSRWSWTRERQNFTLLEQGRLGGALRVAIREDQHRGGNLAFMFDKQGLPEPEELYYRFYVRFGADFDGGRGGKLFGPRGTYGRAGWGGRQSHGDDGWSARISFERAGKRRTQLKFYTYHADMRERYGDIYYWKKAGRLDHERWYCVEAYVKLNDPGSKNGILRAWVDGRSAFEKTNIRFRTVDHLRIEQFRGPAVYYGGRWKAPRDMSVDFDNLVLARERVGCADTP
jgi:hypothetical protein